MHMCCCCHRLGRPAPTHPAPRTALSPLQGSLQSAEQQAQQLQQQLTDSQSQLHSSSSSLQRTDSELQRLTDEIKAARVRVQGLQTKGFACLRHACLALSVSDSRSEPAPAAWAGCHA
jgi:septal ring factor EnvC (AmiA/AmiB activator)